MTPHQFHLRGFLHSNLHFHFNHFLLSALLTPTMFVATLFFANLDLLLLFLSSVRNVVAHGRLLHKLDYYGIRENTFHWIKLFLAERTQEVLLEGNHSTQADVTSGVPGSPS